MSGWLPALWISPGTESGALGKREADRPDPRVVAPEVSGSRGDRAWGWVQGSGGLASWSRCSLALPKVIAPDTQDDGWHGRHPGCGSLWLGPVPHTPTPWAALHQTCDSKPSGMLSQSTATALTPPLLNQPPRESKLGDSDEYYWLKYLVSHKALLQLPGGDQQANHISIIVCACM